MVNSSREGNDESEIESGTYIVTINSTTLRVMLMPSSVSISGVGSGRIISPMTATTKAAMATSPL